MPTRAELEKDLKGGGDRIRRHYLAELSKTTGRDTILYASGFTSIKAGSVPSWTLSVNAQDIQCFMAALHGLKGSELDLVLHSPGGSLESAEQIVSYLRSKYKHIRAIIPQNAMSAATMIACACDELIMGKQSAIGPTDPQIVFATQRGQKSVPAHAVIEEFTLALNGVKGDPKLSNFWAARFSDYPAGLFHQCQVTIENARLRLEEWLKSGLLKSRPTDAKAVAEWLASANEHKSHGRPINFEMVKSKGLNVTPLEADHTFQDLVLSLFHAVSLTFDSTPCVKVVENQLGRGMYLRIDPKPQPGPP